MDGVHPDEQPSPAPLLVHVRATGTLLITRAVARVPKVPRGPREMASLRCVAAAPVRETHLRQVGHMKARRAGRLGGVTAGERPSPGSRGSVLPRCVLATGVPPSSCRGRRNKEAPGNFPGGFPVAIASSSIRGRLEPALIHRRPAWAPSVRGTLAAA
ncbi:hypothetical protein HPB47_000504 [Ixodes persulcatus]|uniref:Uncharacterized protein n=1 Tax=Ixodes persulcatus TaxID=34615 RepID=A0AC60PRI5_IXOPE|nr:hypothetical protein HPB47_000504 [Ixodes persulcatus]